MKKTLSEQRALKRIALLFEQASSRPRMSTRYVALARSIASRCRVSIPVDLRRRFCYGCNAFLIPGKNCTVRKRSNIVISCNECGFVKRIGMR